MKKYVVLSMLFLGMAAFGGQAIAADDPAQTAEPVHVGNKVCPVSGEKIENGPGMESATMEYKGKIYNLCCSMCKKDFLKDPEKYSKIADDEVAKEQAM